MRYSGIKVLTVAALALTSAALAPTPAAHAAPSADAIATDKIRDLTLTMRVVDAETNFDELKKIGGAFATTYRFKRMNVAYKYPNKARFESKIAGASVMIVYNGDMKMYRIPLRKEVRNVSNKPGQKQSLLDLGVFSKDYLATDYAPIYLRTEKGLQVYKLTQRNTDNRSHEVVWVNPKTSLIERKQSVNGDNVLQKEMRFKNPAQIRPGIWLPTRLEIYNQHGKLGAVQAIEEIKVNLGVDESRFAIS